MSPFAAEELPHRQRCLYLDVYQSCEQPDSYRSHVRRLLSGEAVRFSKQTRWIPDPAVRGSHPSMDGQMFAGALGGSLTD